VLLPNSFRTALVVRMAAIPRRVGYDRDGRGFLLTDRLLPRRTMGRFVPVPTRDYYLGLARYLGAEAPDPAMQLFTRPEDDARADDLLRRGGFDPLGGRQLVLINPGANFGDAKIWYAERFAAVADRCAREWGAAVAVTGAPKERKILDSVVAATREPIMDLTRLGLDLSLLKSVVRRASLMVTNDTGPRHIAAALGIPVVTIFGPTDPAWTEIDFAAERKVSVPVFCGPCQKKKCPLDHRCMKLVTPEMVFEQAAGLLGAPGSALERAATVRERSG
jgi:heptosyltransferase-2